MAPRSGALARTHPDDRGQIVRCASRTPDATLRRPPDQRPHAPIARQGGNDGEIGEDGQILVENHFVGRLDGFRFTPDSSSDGIHGKAARNAATQILVSELARRAEALGSAADDTITLSSNGRILWQGCEIGRLVAGDTALKPRIELFADETLSAPDKARVATRLDAWLAAHLDTKLKPLVELSNADDLTGLVRGLAFQITENLGVLRREGASTISRH